MSLRAYFAGKAMQGMLACQDYMNELCKVCGDKEMARTLVARFSCKQADALIAELERPMIPKDVELRGPDGKKYKFELGGKVRLREGELIRFDGNEGVVRTRAVRSEGELAYELAVLVKGERCSVWLPEDKLEAVEAPPFKKGQRVRVKADAGTTHRGCAGVVEGATRGWGVGRNTWKVEVLLDDDDRGRVPFYADSLEAFEYDREGEE